MAVEIISRADARAQGLKRFFTAEPCKNGHVAERYLSSGMCSVCCVLLLRERYLINPDYERGRSKSWRNLNPEKARESWAKYRLENPEKCKAAKQRWESENPDKVRAISRRNSRVYREKNPEKCKASRQRWAAVPENKTARLESSKAWAAANPEKRRTAARNRRARIAGSGGKHTTADLVEILNAQRNRCAYCKINLNKAKKHVDHIVPIVLGGSNARSNLQYLCAPCNQTKNAKHPINFARERGLLL